MSSLTNLQFEFISSPPASPASFSSTTSSSSSSSTSDSLCYTASSTDSGYPSPVLRIESDSPATSPEVSCTPKPLLTAPTTTSIRRSLSRPASSVGLPAFVNSMTFGFKDKSKGKSQKNSSPKVSTSTTPFPTTESNDANTTPQPPSRTVRLVSATLGRAKLQKKKSLASFLNSLSNQDTPVSSTNASSSSDDVPSGADTSATERSRTRVVTFNGDDQRDDGEANEKFEAKDKWTKRLGMKMHPYGADAPYMQSFERVSIDNDAHTDQLLNRINQSGAPTFHTYGKKPPMTVLDLGCGQGTWVSDAADAWKQYGTTVTGFDMVNLVGPVLEEHDNVRFVQGNFVKYPLPFHDDTFDLVRMANLSLCIPYDKWLFVFSEIKRVLSPNGRLELIDDQIFFPYGTPSPIGGADATGAAVATVVDSSGPISPTAPTSKVFPVGTSAFDDDEDLDSNHLTNGDESDIVGESVSSGPSLDGERTTSTPGDEESDSFDTDTASTLVDSDASTLPSARSSMQSDHSVLKKHVLGGPSPVLPLDLSLPPIIPTAPITLDASDSDSNESDDADTSSRPLPPTRPIPDIPVQEPIPVPVAAANSLSSSELITNELLSPSTTITPESAPFAVSIETPTPSSTPTPSTSVSLDTLRPKPAQTQVASEDDACQGADDDFVPSNQSSASDSESLPDVYATWEQCTSSSQELEVVFEKMLKEKFGIHPRPYEFILGALKSVFGEENAEKVRSMHIRLAPPECNYDHEFGIEGDLDSEGTDVSKGAEASKKKPWITIQWDKKEKRERKAAKEAARLNGISQSIPEEGKDDEALSPSTALPEGLSAKAASKLGILPSEMAAVAATLPTSTPIATRAPSIDSTSATSTFIANRPVQSPGLIVLPSTFIPVPPSELEMHACKHMHMLLECKPALRQFIEGFFDEEGRRMCGDEEFEEAIWEYECFRRQRFNWPAETPELHFGNSDNPADGAIQPKHKNNNNSPPSSSTLKRYSRQTSYAPEELTHVRTLRIYGAVKKAQEAAPILMKSHSGIPSRPGTSKGSTKPMVLPTTMA